ncbi:nucleotidyltransferase family protein [Ramlibacter sp. AW1]|uniref:Nucleotidyltransferase family protein n=2 Tax=Ramlibacter aurantiacus TaxID=2801330 RepID=A0A936ZPN7_9BURK|nr:nucleotidyltransferase family protein [Ramlibacter aurantiacus]
MLLAAGRGERMRPLTDTCPKPLLGVRGKPLLRHHLEALARGGFDRVVINTAWLGDQIEQAFGHALPLAGLEEPMRLAYSHEGRDFGAALETAGGIARALPLLDEVFWIAAGDVYMPGFEFSRHAYARFASGPTDAHLWLVPNPPHHPGGDFGLAADGRALNDAPVRHTYSTVGLYRRRFFDPLPMGNPEGIRAALGPMLRRAMDNGQVSAELWTGPWTDVGTPQRLAELNAT